VGGHPHAYAQITMGDEGFFLVDFREVPHIWNIWVKMMGLMK